MKINKLKIRMGLMLTLIMSALLTSCSLDVQESFDFKPGTFPGTQPFENINALQFIDSQVKPEVNENNGRFVNGNFNYLSVAIRMAGLEEVYTQQETSDRTYILLQNQAFYGNGRILDVMTSNPRFDRNELNDLIDENNPQKTIQALFDFDPNAKNRLRAILLYNTVSTFINRFQGIGAPNTGFEFKSLLSNDESGLIYFSTRTNTAFSIDINDAQRRSNITLNRGFRRVTVFASNYIFNNGVGHQVNNLPIGNVTFNSEALLEVIATNPIITKLVEEESQMEEPEAMP